MCWRSSVQLTETVHQFLTHIPSDWRFTISIIKREMTNVLPVLVSFLFGTRLTFILSREGGFVFSSWTPHLFQKQSMTHGQSRHAASVYKPCPPTEWNHQGCYIFSCEFSMTIQCGYSLCAMAQLRSVQHNERKEVREHKILGKYKKKQKIVLHPFVASCPSSGITDAAVISVLLLVKSVYMALHPVSIQTFTFY